MNSQSPSFRQHVLGMTKKLFIRLRDGGRSLKKKIGGRNLSVDLMEVQLTYYIEFLRWFAHLQFEALFPGASFPRRTTALQNLKLLLQTFPTSSENGDPNSIFECSEVFTSRTVHILLDCLKDTYDVNKQMAFDLLVACPSSIHPFMDPEFALEWTTTATLSAVSPKAINVSTAAYMFNLLIRKSPHPITLPSRVQPSAVLDDKASDLTNEFRGNLKPNEETSNNDSVSFGTLTEVEEETSIPCQQAFRVLSQLVKILLAHIEVARESLLQAAFEAPIHGVLYCVREIICDFDLSDIAGSKLWQSLVMAILQGCYDVSDVVSPVVTNASPEGNIMDSNGFVVDDEDVVDEEDFAPKAQILLVCCWRAMKEVSLLLGEITKRAPVKEKGSDYGLLSFEEFNVIGQLFTNILLTSKHRGAYELAHEGFVKLCYMLWRCKQRELQSLPERFLTTLLSDISSDTPTPWLCGTRRSAGLPFFVKAIITTEPSTTGKCCFKTVMRELLSTAAKALTALKSNKDTTLPQVHARNILRALYKETKLGEDVYPYVAEGVQVAVEGFLSDSWAVRNSSTLLFSALMNRIFGPQKFQEEKRRQGMTGREFFSRFPSLHSFLIKQLEISLSSVESESNKSIHLHPSLYPVLLLLSRLHPSAMDGNDSTLNMAAFIPYVLRCSKSYVLKTRAMAARALVPLVSGDALPEMFQELLERLPGDTKQRKIILCFCHRVCQNQVHGCLLQIRDFLNSIAMNVTLSTRTKETIANKFVPLLLKHKWLASRQNPCDMTRAVFLCILRKFVLDQTWVTGETQTTTPSSPNLTASKVIQCIIDEAVDETLKNEDGKPELFSIGKTFVKEEIARIALQPIYAKSCGGDLHSTDVSCVLAFLSTSDYEVTLVALKFLHQIFMNCKKASFPGNQINVIVKELLCQVMDPTMQCSCLSELYMCLSLVPRYLKFPWELADQRFVTLSEGWQSILLACQGSGQRTELKCSVLEFSGVLVNQLHEEALRENPKDCVVGMLEEWVSFVETCAENEESELLRLTVTRTIGSGSVSCILSSSHHFNEYLPFRLWKLIVCLLVDDSVDVKVSMAAGLANVFQGIGQDSLKYGSMHSALALQYIVRKPLELFWSQSPVLCVRWLLSLLDDTSADTLETEASTGHHSAYDDMQSIDRLFEKGPTNSYCEDCILAETVFNTISNWLDEHKADTKEIPHRSELLSSVRVFVKKQAGKCDETLSQNVLFFNIYKTMVGLTILNILTQNASIIQGDDESIAIQQALEVVRETGSSLQQIRKRDSGHCFYHFKLQEISEFVLGK